VAQRASSSGGTAVAEAVWDDLRARIGAERVRNGTPDDEVDGVLPSMVAEPADEQEVAATLHWARDAGVAVCPRGGGSKCAWGNQPVRGDLVLSTARLNRVIEHAWADLTVVVEAGVTVKDLQSTLAKHGQQVAVDPLWPERATVGGVLSTNDSGALRLRYGGLRDLIIGVTLALSDGTLARSGGKVVKNVAGYDLPKLATGALGTLGVITQAAFRLYPMSHQSRSPSYRASSFADAGRLILAAQASTMAHTGLQARFAYDAPGVVDIRFEGTGAGIEAQCIAVRQMAAGGAESSAPDDVWSARETLWRPASPAMAIAKFSVLPSKIAEACETIRATAEKGGLQWRIVVQGTGLGWIRLESQNHAAVYAALVALRGAFEREAGSLFVAHHPAAMTPLDAWGSAGDALDVMLRVKQQFDPRGILNPGRFVGGI